MVCLLLILKIKKKKLTKFNIFIPLLILFVLSLPLNLFYQLSEQGSFVNGLQIDYLIFKIYLIDLVILLLFITQITTALQKFCWHKSFFQAFQDWFKKLAKHKPNRFNQPALIAAVVIVALIYTQFMIPKPTTILNFALILGSAILAIVSHQFSQLSQFSMMVIALLIRQLITSQPLIALYCAFNLVVAALMAGLLYQQRTVLRSKYISQAIVASFLVQFILGIYQFFLQKPLLPYYFLGEPKFEPYYRLSRYIFNGQEKILAYASTAHPNILAAVGTLFFLMIAAKFSLTMSRSQKKLKQNIVQLRWLALLLVLTLILIYITQAKTALISLLLGNLIIWQKQLKIKITTKTQQVCLGLILILIPVLIAIMAQTYHSDPSITRRHFLNLAAVHMFADKLFLGQGLNQFTINLEQFSSSAEIVRFIQPAHHVGLLLLAETGFLGVWLLIISYRLLHKKIQKQLIAPLLIISPLLATDHFFYSLQSGRLLLIFFVVYWLSLFNSKK